MAHGEALRAEDEAEKADREARMQAATSALEAFRFDESAHWNATFSSGQVSVPLAWLIWLTDAISVRT